MIPVVFHADALAELREAATRYETQRAGLGADFRAEIEAAVTRIQRNPQAFPVIDAQGNPPLSGHAFSLCHIFFREVEGVVWIGGAHTSDGGPDTWLSRTPED